MKLNRIGCLSFALFLKRIEKNQMQLNIFIIG
jgi:hypothetical protein